MPEFRFFQEVQRMESESKLRLEKFPDLVVNGHARAWLSWQSDRGLPVNSVPCPFRFWCAGEG